MGQQIIRQPDGHYGIFSTITDTIVMWDATEDEITTWFVDQAADQARRDVQRVLGHVSAGNPRAAYFQFAMTWDEALEMDREHGGDASREKASGAVGGWKGGFSQ